MNSTHATSHRVQQQVEQFYDCSGNSANKHGLRQNTLIDKNHIVNFGNGCCPSFSNKSSHSLDLLEMFGSHKSKNNPAQLTLETNSTFQHITTNMLQTFQPTALTWHVKTEVLHDNNLEKLRVFDLRFHL